MFKRVLVANRGEIARRIFRTLRVMGISPVAVYSEADRDAPFVREADHAVAIGPAPAAASYLSAEKILAAAKATKAEAIHPGYGFLSENASFAAACESAGVVFIGPPSSAIEKLGNKKAARELAKSVGVPTVPGAEVGSDDRATLEVAASVGYPILVKAAAGGGGKGMHKVERPGDLESAIASARRESKASFGSDALILERWVDGARHVEVQVIGDSKGAILPILERDCTLQRRHQKIVEECPSPSVDGALRKKLLEWAGKLALAGGYRSAGTLEFLLTPEDEVFFLEMNTRLQVEHPVTELVCGIDLVAWQVAIAAGHVIRDPMIEPRGHAMEVRIYAEDAATGFLPQTGTLTRVRWPAGPGIRVDAGVETGSVVTPHYDPMLGKVIAWGESREAARLILASALRESLFVGVTTNVPFLVAALESDRFAKSEYHTTSVEQSVFETHPARDAVPDEVTALSAAAASAPRPSSSSGRAPTRGPWDGSDGFRLVKGNDRG